MMQVDSGGCRFRRWDEQLGFVTTLDWRRYHVYRFGDTLPVMETGVLDTRNVPQMGAGECIVTIVAAAIGNGVFDGTGSACDRFRLLRRTSSRL